MSYQGFYINLDNSPDRRSALTAELSKYNIASRYQRFPAVDGKACGHSSPTLRPGETGIFLSHTQLLHQQVDEPFHLHVIEDDVLFSSYTSELIDTVVDNGVLDNFDLLFLDVFVPIDLETIRLYKEIYDLCAVIANNRERTFKDFQIVDLKRRNFSSAASYLVNRHSIKKIYELCQAQVDAGMNLPYDLFLRNLVREGTLKAGCLFPFVTSVNPDSVINMAIKDRYRENQSALAAFLLRYSFFVGCDWQRCLDLLPADFLSPETDEHQKVILSVLKFRLFGDYQRF